MHRRLVLLLVASVLALGGCSGDDAGGSPTKDIVVGDAGEGIEGVQAVRVPDNTHTQGPVDYGLAPPAGGAHNPVWVNCGFYDQAFPDEALVHDLEHGAVWLAYSPTLTPPELEVIHDEARQNAKVIATPYDGLKPGVAVVATAWARQLTLDDVHDDRLGEFVDKYQDGPQAPESGGACSGTVGNPLP